MVGDTALVRMVIDELSKTHNWTYEETLEKFYKSKVCNSLSDKRTGVFTFAPRDVVELFNEEIL